jgi:hypothetical protein
MTRIRLLAYAILDGTLIPIDRVHDQKPYNSGKHRRHGINVQVIADAAGRLVWASAGAARLHGLLAPQGAVVVEDRDAFRYRDGGRMALAARTRDEADDRLLGRALPPRRQHLFSHRSPHPPGRSPRSFVRRGAASPAANEVVVSPIEGGRRCAGIRAETTGSLLSRSRTVGWLAA